VRRRTPDGPKINPLLALAAQAFPRLLPFDPQAFYLHIARTFGDLAYYSVGPLRVYQVNHPDLIRQVLVDRADKFHKARFITRGFKPLAGNGLLTSDGDLWRQQRKLMQPAFHHKHVASYADVMVSHTTRMLDSFRDGEIREIHADMMKLTLGVVVKSLFGTDLTDDGDHVGRLMTTVLDATNARVINAFQIPYWMPTWRHLRERRAIRELDAILQRMIQARRASASVPGGDLLSLLFAARDEESGARMSERQLRDEMMTLFLAGHETTANALTWTWYLLSEHPEVDAKLSAELQDTLNGRMPTAADLADLPYTEMVVREAMRLYPPAPAFAREPIEDVMLGGYEVPKGSLVTIITYALHRDARFFEDPERFDPERFAPGWVERIPRYAYLPFGGGPRVCIGNGFALTEARLILATMAQRYRCALASSQPVVPMQLVTLRPKHGLRMRVSARVAGAGRSVAPASPTLTVDN
jgi:cytochrome P450